MAFVIRVVAKVPSCVLAPPIVRKGLEPAISLDEVHREAISLTCCARLMLPTAFACRARRLAVLLMFSAVRNVVRFKPSPP